MCAENSKTLMKEIEEDTNKWKDTAYYRLEELIIQMLGRANYRFNAIPIKIPG